MAATTAPARAHRPAPAPEGARRPALRVVAEPRHARRYLLLGLVVLAAGVFGAVSLNALAAEASFTARTLESDVEELARRYDELTAEVAALSDPARVRGVAVDELGMVRAQQPGFLVADVDGIGGGADGRARGHRDAEEPDAGAPDAPPGVVARGVTPVKQALDSGR